MKSKSLKILITSLIVLFTLTFFSCKQNKKSKAQKIDGLIKFCYENDLFNGAVLIAHHGKVIYKNALGYANLKTKKKLNLDSLFNIGSITKQFTSMAIMILKEHNKLAYDNKLSDFFPDIPKADQITIKHLLTHTSGIPKWTNVQRFRVKGRPGDFIDDITNEDVFEYLTELDSLDFKPGEKYSYSNSGYILLAMIVEKVSKIPFHEFMKKNIFEPLDMKDTLVWNQSKPKIPNKTIGYNEYGDIDDANILAAGDGGIYSTVEDLYKWNKGLYTETLVSKKTLEEAFSVHQFNNKTPTRNINSEWSYGFGWLFKRDGKDNIVYHDGGFNGFSAFFYRELNKHDCLILLSNKGTNGPLYPIKDSILKILDDEPFEYPKISISIKLKKLIDDLGLIYGIEKYHQLRKKDGEKYNFSENQLNSLGYYYLGREKLKLAKAIFKLNVNSYPKSGNTYDSYAEACMLLGEYDEAIRNYEKSLKFTPDNDNAKKMIKRIKENQK